MNRIKTSFFGFLVFVFAIFAFTPTARAVEGTSFCETGSQERPLQEVYKEQGNKSDATGDENPHSFRSSGTGIADTVGQMHLLFYGPERTIGCTPQVALMSKEERSAGLLKFSNEMVSMAFFAPIQVDIPTHYAGMLLPKEFRGITDYPAYAAEPGSWSTNAITYLDANTGLGISKLWGLSFAFAMMGFVIVLLYAGFMIMFRQKLGGQAIVTVSMSLQNLVIGILFALASFALGGFFLNLSKFLIIILHGMFNGPSGGILPSDTEAILNLTPFALVGRYGDLLRFEDMNQYFDVDLDPLFDGDGMALNVDLGGAMVAFFAKIILAFMLFTAGFRVFFTLFTTYIRMILDIILAPVYFMVASLPGKQDAYMGWVRKMFKNALVPPMIFLFVNLALFIAKVDLGDGSIVESISGGAISSGGIEDGFINAAGPQIIIAVMIFLMAPAASNILDELLGTQGSKASSAASDPVKKAASSAPIVGGFFK